MVNLKQARIFGDKLEGASRRAASVNNYEGAITSLKELKELSIDQQNYIKDLVAENEMMREYILDKVFYGEL